MSDDDPHERSSTLYAARRWLRNLLLGRSDASLKEVLEETIEEHEEQGDQALEPEEKLILHNVLSLGELDVNDIMIPRADIIAVPHDISLEELKAFIAENHHTRMPVYQDTLDKIIGFIHVKDLLPILAGDAPYALSNVMRRAPVVPPSMRILDLLLNMRQSGSHIAIVIDEYGGTDGLVTMEDVFEELVGDIQDEHDEDEVGNQLIKIEDGVFEVSARMPVSELEEALRMSLTHSGNEDDFDTLGGLIFHVLGRVPVKGEIVQHESGVHFEITDADSRRIHRVRIVKA